jgi:hypothetical protein
MPLEQAPTVLPGRLPPAKPVPGEAEEVPPPSHKRALMMDQELASVAQLHRQVRKARTGGASKPRGMTILNVLHNAINGSCM